MQTIVIFSKKYNWLKCIFQKKKCKISQASVIFGMFPSRMFSLSLVSQKNNDLHSSDKEMPHSITEEYLSKQENRSPVTPAESSGTWPRQFQHTEQ